ncbi:MAG: hypothetical protein NT166_24660 [Candidatus Aminicenantes bacterium]|nr:hypothetical protein [Candidatus Aminicenantes bacterium]
MRDTFLAWREQVLKSLGGLPAPEVKNELVERGKLIAVLRGNTYFSHPTLVYGT